jgi:hypothetical protein
MPTRAAGTSGKWGQRVKQAWSAIIFAVFCWLIFLFTVGSFIFLGGLPDSWGETGGPVLGLVFLLSLILGGLYGWRRGRRKD